MKEKIILLGIIIAILVVVFGTDISNSMLGKSFEQFSKPDWSQVQEPNIVKNSILITLLDESLEGCTVSAEKFELIIDHQYFVRSDELAKELHYDKENNTLLVPCDMIPDEPSKLHVWYATQEALNHATKYEYFIAPIED